jgi:capsular polysaccharide transport system ATP-binding protein
MIELRNIRKTYGIKNQRRLILKDVTCCFQPGVNTGILGRNGAGKSTLLRIIGGKEPPDRGRVIRTSRISWPIGFSGCFHGQLTGRENLRFVCRIYGVSFTKVADFVADFSELGPYLDMPVKTYSSGMAAKLAFGLSMALDFDFYLIDELTAVGDASFKAKSKQLFDNRRAQATLLVVSHSIGTIKAYCDQALVLDQGELLPFPDLNQAIAYYQKICLEPATYHFAEHESDSSSSRPNQGH